MKNWLPILRQRLRTETALVRVVVATVRGSAPREAGACMLIGKVRVDGTIGGGHLELKATEIARQMLAQPAAPARLDRFALGATLGQCCGGAVNLWFERYEASDAAFVATALDVHRVGEAAVMMTLPHAGGGISRTVHTRRTPFQGMDEATGRSITAAADALLNAMASAPRAVLVRADKQDALLERIDQQGLPLWLFGAGHVGKALVNVLTDLPFQVTWIDSREHEFPAVPPAHVAIRHAAEPAALVDVAPPAAYFLVMTHSHDLDYEICRAILRRNDFAWAGLIGSETKAACFNLRFGREEIPAESVARLVSPIGIVGIDSKLPGAIAISVTAQLLQVAQAAQQSDAIPATPLLRRLQKLMNAPETPPPAPRLVLRGISKRYPTVVANENIDLTVNAGEIHALLGENGAGKSTLMKIVYGVTKPDTGTITWEGREVTIPSPAAARHLGIGMVFQHFALFESLTVAENIILALDEPEAPAALAKRITEVSERYGLPIDPHRMVHSMSVGERQRVEIVRCLLQKPRLLIMDEPTSVLTPQAVLKLFETLRRLAAEGCSILYISHKLDEIRALCDTATVLRGGKVSGFAIPKQETSSSLARMMIGSELPECKVSPKTPEQTLLELINLNLTTEDPFGTHLKKINLRVRSGEIVGIAGVSGNGQKELMAAISGEVLLNEAGAIRICGQPAGRMNPAQRRRVGLTFVPEERLGRGAVPPMTLSNNALLTGSRHGMVNFGFIRRVATREYAKEVIERFKVVCGGHSAFAASLSGGNLQKYIVGRETMLKPKVMVVSQPTWGVDVGASMLIRQALIDLRDSGVAVLVISEELDELFMISDRLAVIAEGRLSASHPAAETNLEQIGVWMSGQFEAAETSVDYVI